MKRREFMTLLAGAAAWPLAARGQQPAMPVIGFLSSAAAEAFVNNLAGFRRGLSEVGYVEGQNVAFEYRWAGGQYDRLPALATDLARREVTVMVASGGAVSALAAKAATSTIPIVFVMGDDPVRFGVVASLNRPSSNVTGVTLFISELMAKRLELLSQAMPSTPAIAMLVNPKNPNAESEAKEIEAAARTSGRAMRKRQHRKRHRRSLCDSCPTAGRRALGRYGYVLVPPARSTRGARSPPYHSRDLFRA